MPKFTRGEGRLPLQLPHCQRRRENASTGRSKTASRRMPPNAPREGFCCAKNRMRSVLPHRRMFPRRRALPNQACSVASIDPPAEPQLPFLISKSMLTDVGPVELWATPSVVQAQRQIHRAFAGSYAATYALRHTRHADPPLALLRKIGATRLLFRYQA